MTGVSGMMGVSGMTGVAGMAAVAVANRGIVHQGGPHRRGQNPRFQEKASPLSLLETMLIVVGHQPWASPIVGM